jgi:hypothetical protein
VICRCTKQHCLFCCGGLGDVLLAPTVLGTVSSQLLLVSKRFYAWATHMLPYDIDLQTRGKRTINTRCKHRPLAQWTMHPLYRKERYFLEWAMDVVHLPLINALLSQQQIIDAYALHETYDGVYVSFYLMLMDKDYAP